MWGNEWSEIMNITTDLQWLLYFYIYCFLGWIFESCYVSARKKHWVNRGFLHGPMLPIYGSGAIMMLVVSEPFKENYLLAWAAGVVGATALEYVVGAALEAIFKVRYWDYSDQRFNIKGYVCLSSSITWGFLTIAMNAYIHPSILTIMRPVPILVQEVITVLITVGFSIDTVLSVKDALELRDIILRIEEAKEEVERLHRRIDIIMAFAEEDKKEFLEDHPRMQQLDERIIDQKRTLAERRLELKGKLEFLLEKEQLLLPKLPEKQQLEFLDIKTAFGKIEQFRDRIHSARTGKHRRSLKNNPTMRSLKHSEAFETLRDVLKL